MDKQKLIETLGVQSVSGDDKLMVEFLEKELAGIDCYFHHNQDDGNIYVTKGEADHFPCVVAHMDTVHKIVEDLYVLQVGNKLTGFNRIKVEQTGIGGDDKVGIFIALECLKEFDNIKAVFFCDEEIGCFGSYDADMSFFDDVGMVLQCDRQGNSDFVHNAGGTPLSSKAFRKAAGKIMRDFGYDFKEGMMTDVMALKESGLNCSCANMSCGYYHPHSAREYVDIDDVENCLDMVIEMFTIMGGLNFAHTYTKPKYHYYKGDTKPTAQAAWLKELNKNTYKELNTPAQGRLSRSYWDGFDDDWVDKSDKKHAATQYCDSCLESTDEVMYMPEFNMDVCNKCMSSYYGYSQEKTA